MELTPLYSSKQTELYIVKNWQMYLPIRKRVADLHAENTFHSLTGHNFKEKMDFLKSNMMQKKNNNKKRSGKPPNKIQILDRVFLID